MASPTIRVMLDHSVVTHAEFATATMQSQQLIWGAHMANVKVLCFARRPLKDANYQAQIDALFTIGRLIREQRLSAYTYPELQYEAMNDYIGAAICNALKGCRLQHCEPPVERSYLQQGNFLEFARKGGKKDRDAGKDSALSQIAFFRWLCGLTPSIVQRFLASADRLGLSDFQKESIREIPLFQAMCKRAGSEENYPDMFHIWAAERNGIDVFLTLERRLPNLISQITKEKSTPVKLKTKVLRPLELLQMIGITSLDPVPMQTGRLYSCFDKFS